MLTGGPFCEVLKSSWPFASDSIVTARPVPPNGPFQDLVVDGDDLSTEFGPGDQGFVGGRWHLVDTDGNPIRDDNGNEIFFVCPLLGPGRLAP